MNDIFLNPTFKPKKKKKQKKKRKIENNKPLKRRKLSKKEESEETLELSPPNIDVPFVNSIIPSLMDMPDISSLTPEPIKTSKLFTAAYTNPDKQYGFFSYDSLIGHCTDYSADIDPYTDEQLSSISKHFRETSNISSNICELYKNNVTKNDFHYNQYKMFNSLLFDHISKQSFIYVPKKKHNLVSQVCLGCTRKLIFMPIKDIGMNEYIGITICKQFPFCIFPICRSNYVDKWMFIIKKIDKNKKKKPKMSEYEKKRKKLKKNTFDKIKIIELIDDNKQKKKKEEQKQKHELWKIKQNKDIWDGYELCDNPYGLCGSVLNKKMKEFECFEMNCNEIRDINDKLYGVKSELCKYDIAT